MEREFKRNTREWFYTGNPSFAVNELKKTVGNLKTFVTYNRKEIVSNYDRFAIINIERSKKEYYAFVTVYWLI